MVILALLEIPEPHAADAIIETVCGGIPVRQRLRRATQRIIATRRAAVTVRFAVLARPPAILCGPLCGPLWRVFQGTPV